MNVQSKANAPRHRYDGGPSKRSRCLYGYAPDGLTDFICGKPRTDPIHITDREWATDFLLASERRETLDNMTAEAENYEGGYR